MDRPARCPVCGAEVDSCGCTNTDCGYARSVALRMCPDCGWDETIFRHNREQCQSRQIHQWAMVRDAENDAKSEALRAMQAEGQKLADLLKEWVTWPGGRGAWTKRVVEALAAWGMVAMGFERHEPPGEELEKRLEDHRKAVRDATDALREAGAELDRLRAELAAYRQRGEEHADDAKP